MSEQHEAGRALDALVATRVMGHGVSMDVGEDGAEYACGHMRQLPRYSSDIAAAMLVVERMLEFLPERDLHMETLGGNGWKVGSCYSRSEGAWDEWVEAPTLPLAICRAALLVAGDASDVRRVAEGE